jgi:hypothetical protein
MGNYYAILNTNQVCFISLIFYFAVNDFVNFRAISADSLNVNN